MFRTPLVRRSLWAVVVLVASSWSVVHGQRAAGAAPDAVSLAALLQAPTGAWAVTGGQLTPLENGAVPIFAQADAYRRTDAGVLVPVAVGATVGEPWSVHVRVVRAGDLNAASSATAADLTLNGGPGQVRETRELTLQPGSYEMVAVLVRKGAGRSWIGTVDRRPLVVPSMTPTVLETSPVVMGEAVTSEREAGAPRPFVFGATSMKPAAANRFHQADKLHLAFRIYGWKPDAEARPDLTVEYVFQQVFANGPRFFNKTKPQEFNAKTLSKLFDGQAAMLAAGISVPLTAFPPGEFQVVVRVKDKRTQLTTVQKASFVVASDRTLP